MARSVPHTPDFDRIMALPRRTITDADLTAWSDVITPLLRDPRGNGAGSLRGGQALVMAECSEAGGVWAALPVGYGKTLVTHGLPLFLAQSDHPRTAERPLLIVPASLREKTWADFAAYEGTWKMLRHPYRVMSREELCLDQNADFLRQYRPTLIVVDEADDLANSESAAVRRLDRYRIDTWDDPEIMFACLTGTPERNSIMSTWHLLCWCLRDRAPVYMQEHEMLALANAIDERPRGGRVHPGPWGATRKAAVDVYARRLRETPGVVIIDGDSCKAPLVIYTRPAREDPILDATFERFLRTDETPRGIVVKDPLSRWRCDGVMGCGIEQYYDPPPPDAWRVANRAEARFVRDVIDRSTRSHRPLDTEMQVLRRHREHPIVKSWLEIRDTYDAKMHTRSRWITDSVIQSAIDWLRESDTPGIVWCGSVEFGERLAREARLAYYGKLGKGTNGCSLFAAPVGQNLVASWNANKKGFNLQAWPRQLLVYPPQSAKWLEQIFGRSHRSGQDQPVHITLLMTSGGTVDAFEAAFREARFAKSTVSLTQKILRAKIIRTHPTITEQNQFRWATRKKEKE